MQNQLRTLCFKLLILGSLCSSGVYAYPGGLKKFEIVGRLSKSEIDAQKAPLLSSTPIPASKNGVVYYKVTYETKALDQSAVLATGLLIVPDSSQGRLPLVSFQHGTTFPKSDAPSANLKGSEDTMATFMYGSLGYVVAAADYLGLGDSPGLHPYLHAASEAWACADFLRASKEVLRSLRVELSGQLFLTGYSQGGHSTMALHRFLERHRGFEFKVTASTPMAGPYDLSGTTLTDVLTSPAPYASSAEVSYVLLAMNRIYHIFPTEVPQVFLAPYGQTVPPLLDGYHSVDQVIAALPATPKELLEPGFISELLSDPHHPFVEALRKNNVYNWKPVAPVRLYFGGADHEVPFANSKVAYRRMKALGARIRLINVGETLDHPHAAMPAFEQSSAWFESLRY